MKSVLGKPALVFAIGLKWDSAFAIVGVLVIAVGIQFLIAYVYRLKTGRDTGGMRFGGGLLEYVDTAKDSHPQASEDSERQIPIGRSSSPVVTHRFSPVRHVGKIRVLEDAGIAHVDRQDEQVEREGLCRELLSLQ